MISRFETNWDTDTNVMMDELVGAFNQEMATTWEKTDGSFAALVKSVNLC